MHTVCLFKGLCNKDMAMYKTANISCLILAAGSARRFGRAKLLYTLADGRSILQTTLGIYTELFDLVTVICNDNTELIKQAHNMNAKVEVNPLSHMGMSESIKLGINITRPKLAWLIALADMPYVEDGSIVQLCQLAERNKIIQPYVNATPGNPVLIGIDFLSDLLSLEGDVGAKSVLQSNNQSVVKVDLNDLGLTQDVDTPGDVKRQ